MQILLQGLSAKSEILSFSSTEQYTISSLYSLYNINTDDAYFISNGKIIDVSEDLSHYNDCIIHCHYRLLGGKGGFGSLLKGQPAVKKQTKNFDACRDISGRRLRHVNQEKQIMEWQQKKEEEEKIIEQYNNSGKEDEIKAKLYEDKKNDLIKQNKKFFDEENNAKNSVKKSINNYLNKKRKHPNNPTKPKKEEKPNKIKEILHEVKDKQNKMSKEELLNLILD